MVAGIDPAINRTSLWGADRKQNPFFSLLQEEFLPPLLPADCTQMVRNIGRQVGLSFNNEAADFVAECSGGHPQIARQLCSLAYRNRYRKPGEMTLAHLRKAADQFVINPKYNFVLGENGLWGNLTDGRIWSATAAGANQEILYVLASSPGHVPKATLLKGGDPVVRGTCLFELQERSILRSTEGPDPMFSITFGVFRRWIRWNRLGLEA